MARSTEREDELEEERRLMYVAMTRARNQLAVSYPVNVYSSRRSAEYSMDQLSRFIDRGVREKMQRVALAAADEAPAPPVSPAPEKVDLLALLRGRFGAAEAPRDARP
jgi:DNA helicase-2/ATP-dependent DNA helicase PcrA